MTLSVWTIYDHPRDQPEFYVARRWELDRPTSDTLLDRDIENLRDKMQALGLVKLMRHPEDDPVIMETWI
jgi:hypothetical protein